MASQIQKTARIGPDSSSTSLRPRQLLEPKAQAGILFSSQFRLSESSISTMRRTEVEAIRLLFTSLLYPDCHSSFYQHVIYHLFWRLKLILCINLQSDNNYLHVVDHPIKHLEDLLNQSETYISRQLPYIVLARSTTIYPSYITDFCLPPSYSLQRKLIA